MLVRKRVSQACRPCGLKKIKCDGIYPQCGPCSKKDDCICTYGISKRNRRRRLNVSQSPVNGSASILADNFPGEPVNGSPPKRSDESGEERLRLPAKSKKGPLSTISPDVALQLFQSYFDCIHPLWPLLYKPLYSSLDFTCPSRSIPIALVAAIFAIAACVMPATRERDKDGDAMEGLPVDCPEPRLFFEEALELLQCGVGDSDVKQPINMLKPTITHCQVLTLLALQQHGVAEYSRAGILSSLAVSMAIELRLHRAPKSSDSVQNEIRSRLWWNVFIVEKMLSWEMGRPVTIRSEETDTPYPSVSESDEFDLMYIRVRGNDTAGKYPRTSIKLRTISGLHSSIKLAMLFERVSRELYGVSARNTIREYPQIGEDVRTKLWLALQEWYIEMEAGPLKLDLGESLLSVPASITNYVIMWSGAILIHRPFIATSSQENDPATSQNPANICLQAANNICLIVEKYADRLHGLPCDMIFPIFTAASTLLYHLKESEDPEIRRRLKLCIHWLAIFGKSWKSAGTRYQLLADWFDLPHELPSPDVSQNKASVPQPPSQLTPSQHVSQQDSGLILTPNSVSVNLAQDQIITDEWTFLRDFGDATDEFYVMDQQLRGLLEEQFGAETFSYL
ncbi:fungal-specific transcription factor domain-containing protein [Xylogone sp. PMI_703]|nr:fungal-specific transcription factor domain-containing protein [Xylogone sp. PMI_703]